jgi:hypothetical protein
LPSHVPRCANVCLPSARPRSTENETIHLPSAHAVSPPKCQDLSISAWKEPPSKHRKSSHGDKPTRYSFVAWRGDDEVSIEPYCDSSSPS